MKHELLKVAPVNVYFNDLSEQIDNHSLEIMSSTLTVRKLKIEFALLSLKFAISHFSVSVLYSSTLSSTVSLSSPPNTANLSFPLIVATPIPCQARLKLEVERAGAQLVFRLKLGELSQLGSAQLTILNLLASSAQLSSPF